MTTAAYYGANYTVIDNLPAGASLIEANEWGGVVKAVADTITISATLGDTDSLLYIGKLPKNSIPLSVTISSPAKISWGGTIGWSGDADALGDFAAGSAAASVVTGPAAATAIAPTTETKSVYITTATAALVSADSISTCITYIQAG